MTRDRDPRPYRKGVGIVLINGAGHVFAGRRIDSTLEAWQMPQGGIDEDEAPLAAALRELEEEVGTRHVDVLAESRDWLHYDLPAELRERVWKGRYRGQMQKWFAMRFLGADEEIDIATASPEFDAWRWLGFGDLATAIVPFKRALYARVFDEFRAYLAE